MKIILTILLTALCPIAVFSQVDIPACPNPTLPDIDSGHWDVLTNWPKVLTNNNLTYTLSVRYKSPDGSQSQKILGGISSGGEYTAYYPLAPIHTLKNAENRPENEWDVAYGPHFGWRPDDSIYMRGFQHPEGIEEMYYYTTNDTLAKAWFTDYRDNRSVMVIYDSKNMITGFSEAAEKEEHPYSGVTRSILNGKEVEDCDFFSAFKEHRKDELGRNRTQQVVPPYGTQGAAGDP